MESLRDVIEKLPIDPKYLRRVPIPALKGRCVLEIDLGRGFSEATPTSPLAALRERNTPALRSVIAGLRQGAADAKVVGLIVHAGAGIPLTQAQELAGAIAHFRESGKPTVGWSETYGEMENGVTGYLVASACETVWLQPSGDLVLRGSVLKGLFLRGVLDRFGVIPEFSRRAEYKSAAETFLAESMSEPNREMLNRIVESCNDSVITQIAKARGMEPAVVREVMLERGRLSAQAAKDEGFVDHLGYRDDAFASLTKRFDDAEVRYVDRYRKAAHSGVKSVTQRNRPVVAVVNATGAILLGRASGGGPASGHSVYSDALGAALRSAGRDDDVVSVILRIESPGGSYIASDAIRAEVLRLREQGKRVVASMGGVAASGGYFIAMPCERIVANPASLTGSIGVLAGKMVLREALARQGVNRQTVSHGARDEMFSPERAFTGPEWADLDKWLDDVYADFTGKAAADRGMALADLEPLARGRVWTGADAAERGLVDTLGGLDDAIVTGCGLAGLRRTEVVVRRMPKLSPMDQFMPSENSDAPIAAGVWDSPGLFGAAALRDPAVLLDRLAQRLGLDLPGVLTMPGFELR